MGGLVKTSSGYMFAGANGGAQSNPRNVFILTFDEALSACGRPVYLTKHDKNSGHAGHPKIAAIGEGRYLVLWELFEFSTQRANVLAGGQSGYKSTCMMTIDETGKALSGITELPGIRLNMGDVLRYNAATGKVYWAVTENNIAYGRNTIVITSGPSHILIYALTPPEATATESESS
jgi:hypothetical protein